MYQAMYITLTFWNRPFLTRPSYILEHIPAINTINLSHEKDYFDAAIDGFPYDERKNTGRFPEHRQ